MCVNVGDWLFVAWLIAYKKRFPFKLLIVSLLFPGRLRFRWEEWLEREIDSNLHSEFIVCVYIYINLTTPSVILNQSLYCNRDSININDTCLLLSVYIWLCSFGFPYLVPGPFLFNINFCMCVPRNLRVEILGNGSSALLCCDFSINRSIFIYWYKFSWHVIILNECLPILWNLQIRFS